MNQNPDLKTPDGIMIHLMNEAARLCEAAGLGGAAPILEAAAGAAKTLEINYGYPSRRHQP